jgi:hypothetical protein
MDKREHREGANATQGPNPLDAGHIEGQNPETPQRLPGYTRFLRDRARMPAAANVSWSNALMMGVALAALAALILMLAAAG